MTGDAAKIVVSADLLESWQEIVDILVEMIGIPAALIMRVSDPHIEVLVSSHGEDNPYRPGEKEMLFGSGLYCETVIRTREKLLVPDALADPVWKNNPDVRLNMVSYLGFPILLPDKEPFGTICVLDNKPNEYSVTAERMMRSLRDLIESHLGILNMNQALGDKNKQMRDYLTELQALRGLVSICACCKSIKDDQGGWHPVEHYLVRHPEATFSHGLCPGCLKKEYPGFTDGF